MSTESFERLAAEFYRETGILAPGKDQPAAMGGHLSDEEREKAWRMWIASRAALVIDVMQALRDSLRASGAVAPERPK